MKVFKYIILLQIGFLLLGCDDDFLDEKPKDFLTKSNLLTSQEGFESALTGLYSKVREEYLFGYGQYNALYAGTDIAQNAFPHPEQYAYTLYGGNLTNENFVARRTWSWAYEAIGAANFILTNSENEAIQWESESDKLRIQAEAKFLRAYAYNTLVHLYGGVPLVLEEINTVKLDFERSTKEEVLEVIKNDLLFAAENLPTDELRPGKIVKWAAYHMLAEVYLHMDQPADAEEAANEVINSGKYHLMQERFGAKADQPGDVFSDIFKENNQNRTSGNMETIWAMQLQYNVVGGITDDWSRRAWVAFYVQIPGFQLADSLGGRGVGRMKPTAWWLNLYEDQDIRNSPYNIRRVYYYNDSTSGKPYGAPATDVDSTLAATYLYPTTRKFEFGVPDNLAYAFNLKDRIKMRLAETYLLLAEAQFKQGKISEAAASINFVRNRANATPAEAGDITLDYILDERARELIGEYPRRFTLVRTGKLIERTKLHNPESAPHIHEDNNLWPIPQAVIDANSGAELKQNKGY